MIQCKPGSDAPNKMAQIIEAPNDIGVIYEQSLYTIFLAGSIENGKAEDWQDKLCKPLSKFEGIAVLNPRRKNWNPDLDNKELRKQILWEQDGIKVSELVIFYFDPSTKSPISLLELGQCLGALQRRQDIVVFCPPTFYRYTNVEVTCGECHIKVHTEYNTFLAEIINKISTRPT